MAETRATCTAEAQAQLRQDVARCDATRGVGSPQQHRECLDTAKAKFDAALALCKQLAS